MPPRLEQAAEADIPAIVAIETTPAYAGTIGIWPAARHLEAMSVPGTRYLVWRDGDAVLGYAILHQLDNDDHIARLRRIAVRETGRGLGPAFLRAILAWLYEATPINRLELDVFLENERARRMYERAGFVVEGILREAFRAPDGSYRSQYLMSILRRDWLAGRLTES